MPPTTLERRLAAIVGPAHVLGDPELCASYGRDCTGRFGGPAALVVRPGSTHEVAQVLAACHEAGMAVVAQGGNTGLVGAGVPRGGEVVLSLARLDALGAVDPVAAQVTAARLRLVPAPAHVVTALLGVGSTGDAVDVMRVLRDRVPSLNAVEIFYADGLELVCAHRRLAAPFADRHPVYVVAECAAAADPVQELADALDDAPVLDVAVADDTARRRALWTYREAHNEAIAAAGIPHKLDVTVQLADVTAFESRVRAAVADAAPAARTIIYGHLGDGNLHVNVLGPEPHDERVDEAVLELVGELGGSISAEHGVGVAKRRWLHLTRSPDEIDVMAAVKHALDPHGILNPGVLLPERGDERALVSIGGGMTWQGP